MTRVSAYLISARRTTSEIVSPSSSVASLAASHTSSLTRMLRMVVPLGIVGSFRERGMTKAPGEGGLFSASRGSRSRLRCRRPLRLRSRCLPSRTFWFLSLACNYTLPGVTTPCQYTSENTLEVTA